MMRSALLLAALGAAVVALSYLDPSSGALLVAVAPSVPAVGKVAEKWARRVAGASQDYTEGAGAAGEAWQRGASAGAANYQTGVTQAIGQQRYQKGVARATSAKFVRGVRDKGAQRYGPGAAAAQQDFSTAIGPVLEVIGRTDLPPRGPRGADGNYARSAAVGRALRAFATGR